MLSEAFYVKANSRWLSIPITENLEGLELDSPESYARTTLFFMSCYIYFYNLTNI
jgi:hypothetical protein